MSVLGKVQASLAAASQETTLALANANFDFSLIRCEAPAEYRQLGLALAGKKRSMAEDGPAHTTARRLGSLFQTMLPETPNLIRAYGRRASQIAESEVSNPRGTDADGPFKDYVGIDGTSIWAAATSSPAAIAAHLLACMIAAMWPADEATAIWVELVAERKRRIEEKAARTDTFNIGEVVSSKLDISQEQLALWDASARAWLAAAGTSPIIAEKQRAVVSVLGKINMSVSGRQDLYTSVTEAWTLSLETFEKVILGSSYSIQDGAVLLALASWHIFPDLVILGRETMHIPQHDELVEPGGSVTTGMRWISANPDGPNGVRWSLSLAHLQYYGSKRTTSRSLGCSPSGSSRLSFVEFTLATLGAMIAHWQKFEPVTADEAFAFLRLVINKYHFCSQQLSSTAGPTVDYDDIQVQPLEDALALYYSTSPDERQQAMKCVTLGMRNHGFIAMNDPGVSAQTQSHYRFFGLDLSKFIHVLQDEEDQEKFVRECLEAFRNPRRESGWNRNHCILLSQTIEGRQKLRFYSRKKVRHWTQRDEDGDYIREVHSDGGYVIESSKVLHSDDFLDGPPKMLWVNLPGPILKLLERPRAGVRGRIPPKETDDAKHPFTIVLETGRSAIWVPSSQVSSQGPDISPKREIVEGHLQTSRLSADGFRMFIQDSDCALLRLLSSGWHLSSSTPSVTVSPRVFESQTIESLLDSMLHSRDHPFLTPSMEKKQEYVLQLIAVFETGFASLSADWSRVIAISTEGSIYVVPALLKSPSSRPTNPYELHHIRGNVARPGLSLIGWFPDLEQPECRKADVTQWQIINHRPFDGRLEDDFASTSLHLRFTGYARETSLGAHHRIATSTMVDGLLSAYDAGTWLCDMDVLGALTSAWVRFISRTPGCKGETPITGTKPSRESVMIENWEELLNPHPTKPAVIKCHGNWQARLTALSISVQHRYRTLVLDQHGCWNCAFKLLDRMEKGFLDDNSDSAESTASGNDTDQESDRVARDKSEESLVDNTRHGAESNGGSDGVNEGTRQSDLSEDSDSGGSYYSSEDDTSTAESRDAGGSKKYIPVVLIL